MVSTTVEEPLHRHLALIPQSVEPLEELSILQEEQSRDSIIRDFSEGDFEKHQEASQKGKRVLTIRKDTPFIDAILEEKLLKHFWPLQIWEDNDENRAMELDMLDETRDKAAVQLKSYEQRMCRLIIKR